ncbi:MAG: 50S ribosomal protein L29 [Ignavibacteriae bacterium]|nr:50S ribosomal protein L29 [Ignavibacteriota bacterium]
MKVTEMRGMAEVELAKRILEEEENLAHLKFQKATSQLESPIKIRTTRRTIARMRTVLQELQTKMAATAKTQEKKNA